MASVNLDQEIQQLVSLQKQVLGGISKLTGAAQLNQKQMQAAVSAVRDFGDDISKQFMQDPGVFQSTQKQLAVGLDIGKGWQRHIEEQLRNYVESGGKINTLMQDEAKMLEFRRKTVATYFEKGKKNKALLAKLDDALVAVYQRDLAIQSQITKQKQAISDAYDKVAAGTTQFLGRIPVLGGYLSKKAGRFFGDEERRTGIESAIFSKVSKGAAGGGELTAIGKVLGKLTPVFIILGATLGAVAAALVSLVKAALTFTPAMAKAVGVSRGFAGELKGRLEPAMLGLTKYFGTADKSIEAVTESAGALSRAYGSLAEVTASNVELNVALATRLGMSHDETAAFMVEMTKGWKFSNQQVKEFLGGIVQSSELLGVSFVTVMKDIMESSHLISLYWHRSYLDLKDAAIQARLMGSSIESQLKTAESFSTFEDAVTNAMRLQVITGREFNAMQMFTIANYGDAETIQQDIIRNLAQMGDLQRLNVTQRREISRILGMEFSQVKELVTFEQNREKISKRLKELGLKDSEDRIQAMRQLVNAGKEIRNLTGADVGKEVERIKATRRVEADIRSGFQILGLAETQDALTRIMVAIHSFLTKHLWKIANDIAGWLEKLADYFTTKVIPALDDLVKMVGQLLSIVSLDFFGVEAEGRKLKEKEMRERYEAIMRRQKPEGASDLYWLNPDETRAGGGPISEPVMGIGASGKTYSFGERGPEYVVPTGSNPDMDSLVAAINNLLKQPIQLHTRINLDSRQIARGLTETSLITS